MWLICIQKKQILAFSASKLEVSALKKTFKEAGYSLTGVTAIPFAMQNLVRTGQIPMDHDYFAIVNIGLDSSEVFCFSTTCILLVRSLRTGSLNLVEDLDIPVDTDPIDYLSAMDDSDAKADSAMQETGERLISKIIRTGDYCAQSFTDNTPLQQYTFLGHTDQCKPFMNQAATMIPAQVTTFTPARNSLPTGMEAKLPDNAEKRSQVLTAFSIALSANGTTPNFLYTFLHRQKAATAGMRTLAAVALGIILLVLAGATHFYLNQSVSKGRLKLATLHQEQARFGGSIAEAAVSKAINRAEIRTAMTLRYVQSYMPLAVVSEICSHTPEYIQLTSLVYTLEPGEETLDSGKKQLTLKGRVTAHPYSLDANLGNYIITLSQSPVFGDIEIQNKEESVAGPGEKSVMTFDAVLEVL